MKPAGWSENDKIIRCHRRDQFTFIADVACLLTCELCSHEICASPVTREKYGQPTWHVICDECFPQLIPGNEIRFCGRIKSTDTKLPNET